MKTEYEVPTINMEEIGARITKLRKEKHLKVTDISDQMGFESPQAVYKWQRGDCLPEISNLIILSRMLDTTVEGIILGDEEVSSSLMYLRFCLIIKLEISANLNCWYIFLPFFMTYLICKATDK